MAEHCLTDEVTLRLTVCTILTCTHLRCWNDKGKYDRKHVIRAEEFANSLKASPLIGLGPMETAEPGKFQTQLADKMGIIFFKDYWQRQNEIPAIRSGDHIDLWNMNKTTGYWWSWSRDFTEWISKAVSDRNTSRQIWFWRIPGCALRFRS